MSKYVKWIMKFNKPLRLLLIVMMVVAIVGIFRLDLSSEFDVFVPTESIYGDSLARMQAAFPSKDQIMVQLSFDRENLDETLYEKLIQVNSLLESLSDQVTYNGLSDETIVTQGAYEALAMKLKMMGDLAPIKYLDGKTYVTYTVFSNDTLDHATLKNLEKGLTDLGMTYAMSGDAYVQLKVYDYIFYILTRIPLLAFAILVLVFFSKIRTVKGTFLSVMPAGIGALWTLGIVGYLGKEVSMVTVLAPIFTLVIGSADGLHFITHVQEEQLKGSTTQEALTKTLNMVGLPMIITTVTSVAGFLSLMVMNTEAIKSLAIFASMGIFLAGLATWYVLPLVLSTGLELGYRGKADGKSDKWLKRLWGRPVWLLIGLVAILFVFGAPQIKQEFNMLGIYRNYTEVYKASAEITRVNGGALPVFVYGSYKGHEDTWIKDMSALSEDLGALKEVGQVISVAGILNKAGDKLPPVIKESTLFKELINASSQDFRLMVLPVDHENQTLTTISAYVERMKETYPDYGLEITGVSFMMLELNENMMKNQVTSSLVAVAIVFLLLLLAIRDLKTTLVAIIPIVLTLLTLFGAMGLGGIDLNLISCTIFSITIGVGIDYAIHFVLIWRHHRLEGASGREAANRAFDFTERPILANALGLSLGFSALFLSPLQIHVTVASLMWVAMMSSVAFSLIILPTILSKTRD